MFYRNVFRPIEKSKFRTKRQVHRKDRKGWAYGRQEKSLIRPCDSKSFNWSPPIFYDIRPVPAAWLQGQTSGTSYPIGAGKVLPE